MPAANEKPESEHSDPSDDCSDTGTENSKNDDAEINEIMDVDFEFCVPVEIHFHGIKTLLKQVFSTDFEMINLSELSDLIIKQSSVGSVVKVDDSEDPYALMTVISSLLSKDHECIKQLTEFIIKKANESIREKVKGIMKSNVGFIFNERLINMPYQLAPPLFKSIKEEIDKMNEDVSLALIFRMLNNLTLITMFSYLKSIKKFRLLYQIQKKRKESQIRRQKILQRMNTFISKLRFKEAKNNYRTKQ